MNIVIYVMAAIGLFVVMIIFLVLIKEFIRAGRNSHRLATVWWWNAHGDKSFPYMFWWGVFLKEYNSYYSEKIIGNFVISHDPNTSLRRYE